MKNKKTKKADLERKRPLFFSISLVITLGSVLAAFSYKTPKQKVIVVDKVKWDAPEEFIIPSTKDEEKKTEPLPFTVEEFILADDDADIEDDILDIFDTEPDDRGIDVDAMMKVHEDEKPVDNNIYNFVDIQPEFPGGMPALLSFISKSIKYPVVAQETNVQGRVFVSFVVNEDGTVSNAAILRGVDPALDKEAIRVVNMMPKWKPGMQSGRNVKVNYRIPISFVLQ